MTFNEIFFGKEVIHKRPHRFQKPMRYDETRIIIQEAAPTYRDNR